MRWDLIAKSGVGKKPDRQYQQFPNVIFPGFPHGLNIALPTTQIEKSECNELVNFQIVKGGQVQTRHPITAHTSAVFTSNAAVVAAAYGPIAGTDRELFVDENGVLYYNNAGTPTSIGTLEGAATLLPFAGVCLLLDGSYVKYLDNLTTIKIAYDDGTGTSGYQYNNKSGSADTTLLLGNGTNTRVAAKFTSQAWDAGYTIPPTTLTANLTRIGNGYTGTDNVDIVAKVRKASDDSVMATKTLVSAPIATNLAATATEYEITFSSTDITTELSPSTDYYISLEYNNGDGSNHVAVNCTSVASGGVGYHYAGSWTADTTEDPIISLRPGRPPKASFGVVHNQRPFLAGDPDNPGLVHFGNLTYLDWCTSNGGGYVGSVDANANNYPIGAIVSQFEELYVFGKESQPFICKLTGSTPSAYLLPDVFQRSWTTHLAIAQTPNDIWFASARALTNFTGVEQFGDMRASPFADPVINRFEDYWSSATALMEYVPDTGQLWLVMPDYHRVLVCHTLIPSYIKRKPRYPWSEYEFTRHILTDTDTYKWTESVSTPGEYHVELLAGGDPSLLQPDAVLLDGKLISEGTVGSLSDHSWDYGDNDSLGYSTVYMRDDTGDPDTSGVEIRTCIIPTMLAYVNGKMLVGSSDGIVYKLDTTEYKDLTTHHIRFDLRTAYVQPHIDSIVIERINISVGGKTGGRFTASIYTNNQLLESTVDMSYDLPIDDRLTLDDMTMDLEDAYFLIDPVDLLAQDWLNVECYNLQIRIDNVLLSGNRVAFNTIEAYIRPLTM